MNKLAFYKGEAVCPFEMGTDEGKFWVAEQGLANKPDANIIRFFRRHMDWCVDPFFRDEGVDELVRANLFVVVNQLCKFCPYDRIDYEKYKRRDGRLKSPHVE